MSGLSGTTTHPMDAKGRTSLPARHRKVLPDELVIMRAPDETFPCLWILSEEEHKKWAESLFESKGGFQANSKSGNYFKHKLFGSKQYVTVDQAGRMLIPAKLRQFASLDKTIVIVGADDHIELWDEDLLEKYEEHCEKLYQIIDSE